jgi:hypothetical protein
VRIIECNFSLFPFLGNEAIARPYITIFKTGGYCYEGLPLGGQRISEANRYIWWFAFSDD